MQAVKQHLESQNDLAIISLPQRFTFECHRDFRAAYAGKPVPRGGYVVNFSGTIAIDSAGLGMLLQLCEFTAYDRSKVSLKYCSAEIRETLAIAGFGEKAIIVA